MDARLKKFIPLIKERPREADFLARKWQEFVRKYPEAFSFETEEELHRWAGKHPEINNEALKDILDGKGVQDAYNLSRQEYEDYQMKSTGRVDRSKIPPNVHHSPILESEYENSPKIMEEDKDYQKIENDLKRKWLENNPGKDFTSKEGIDYLYGSLDNENAPALKGEAQKIFRENPKFRERIERYDKEKERVYDNPQQDPTVANLRKTAAEHAKAREELIGSPIDNQLIQKRASDHFEEKYPKKASAYTKTGHTALAPLQPEKQEEDRKRRSVTGRDIYNLLKKNRPSIEAKIGKPIQRTVERSILGIGRATGSAVGQAGRGVVMGIRGILLAARAAPLIANPYSLAVIGIVLGIIIVAAFFVILIILLAGGISGGKPVATVECVDSSGVVTVTDGNECAQAMSDLYTNTEGIPVSAVCLDKCTDSARSLSCNRDPSTNECDIILYGSCGGDKVFCIQYSPANPSLNRLYDCATGGPGYVGSPLGVNSCDMGASPPSGVFFFTGAPQTWTVPPGVTEIEAELWGAEGAWAVIGEGGNGGYVKTKLAVIPGSTLWIYVGGTPDGNDAADFKLGGWNGGGDGGGGVVGVWGFGGGGASDIRIGGTAFSNRVAIAGGGGGAGIANLVGLESFGGGGGATKGEDGEDGYVSFWCSTGAPGELPQGGMGGTDSAGGAGGSASNKATPPGGDGQQGSLGIGGKGGDAAPLSTAGTSQSGIAGGGGGGGYFGGGGGGSSDNCARGSGANVGSAAGGGGSNWVTSDPTVFIGPTTSQRGVRLGHGQVIIK